MSGQIDAIINQARSYIGITEEPLGSNNVIFNTRYYGVPVFGDAYPWCVVFLWCLFQDINAPSLFYGGGKTASTSAMLTFANSNGLFVPSNFQKGDLIIFDFTEDGINDHMGICEVSDSGMTNTITTIDGNTSDGVYQRVRPLNMVTGAYRPKYAGGYYDDNEHKFPAPWLKYHKFINRRFNRK